MERNILIPLFLVICLLVYILSYVIQECITNIENDTKLMKMIYFINGKKVIYKLKGKKLPKTMKNHINHRFFEPLDDAYYHYERMLEDMSSKEKVFYKEKVKEVYDTYTVFFTILIQDLEKTVQIHKEIGFDTDMIAKFRLETQNATDIMKEFDKEIHALDDVIEKYRKDQAAVEHILSPASSMTFFKESNQFVSNSLLGLKDKY